MRVAAKKITLMAMLMGYSVKRMSYSCCFMFMTVGAEIYLVQAKMLGVESAKRKSTYLDVELDLTRNVVVWIELDWCLVEAKVNGINLLKRKYFRSCGNKELRKVILVTGLS